MPAAVFLASSFVMRLASARRPGSLSKQETGHGKLVGVADNVGDAAISLHCARWRKQRSGIFPNCPMAMGDHTRYPQAKIASIMGMRYCFYWNISLFIHRI